MMNDERRELRSLRLPKTSPAASDGASFAAHPFRALNSKGGVRCEPRSQASSEVIIPRARNGNEGGCHLAHGSHALGTRVVPATSANPFAKRFSLARVRSPSSFPVRQVRGSLYDHPDHSNRYSNTVNFQNTSDINLRCSYIERL